MKKPGALRPHTSYLLAFLALAGSGALAGAALADGLPPVLPTSVGPTTPAPPAVSVTTPVATATLSLPTVTTPAVTTPTATTPTVTAPTATVPSVTTPVVTTPAATTPALATPAVTTPPSASPAHVVHGAVHAVTAAATPIVQAAATRKAPVPLPTVTTSAVTLPSRADARTVIAAVGGTTGSTLPFSASVAALVPQPQPDRLSASPLKAPALIANAIEGAPPVTAVSVLRSPLVAPLVAGVARSRDGSTPSRQLPANRTSGAAGWSGAARDPVTVAGGLALLVALLGLGAAGAARSSTGFVAACAELGRFPFPRFRVLPCDRFAGGRASGADAASVVAGGTAASADVAAAGRRVVVARMAQVLGAQAHSAVAPAMRAWELLKTIVLTILVAANGLLLAIRWQLGRWQSR